jgi:hypothetical protein
MSIDKVRRLRREAETDEALLHRVSESPEAMVELLEERGIPEHLAVAMAAEDFQTEDFAGAQLGLWTWDCCCSTCCFTCWSNTTIDRKIAIADPGRGAKRADIEEEAQKPAGKRSKRDR